MSPSLAVFALALRERGLASLSLPVGHPKSSDVLRDEIDERYALEETMMQTTDHRPVSEKPIPRLQQTATSHKAETSKWIVLTLGHARLQRCRYHGR